MKRIVIPVVLFICLALGGLLVVRSRVQQPQLEQGGPVDPDSLIKLNDDGPAPVPIAAPSDSILFFGNDMGAARLATDMQSGVIPTAYAFSKPVLATRVGGIPDMVREGETGLLVPPNDPGALQDALRRLITDPPLRARLGKAGKKFAEEELSWTAIAEKHADFYRKFINI